MTTGTKAQQIIADSVAFTLNGESLVAFANETIIETAARYGVDIPHLCYKPGYRCVGNCRACMVEVDSERVLAPACVRKPAEGMTVRTDTERTRHAQRMVLELLAADVVGTEYTHESQLAHYQRELGVAASRLPAREQPAADLTHPAIAVNLDACIQCTRCVRACREEQVNDVIGYAYRGAHAKIVFDLDDPMAASTCVGCGECVQACPTGALMPAENAALAPAEREVDSLCPYCGVGCQLTFHLSDDKITSVTGRDGPANHSRLCVKGRYGFEYARHAHRLTTPLIRREGMSKQPNGAIEPNDLHTYFREATWEEALDTAARGWLAIRDEYGAGALAGFGSAKGSNEEAYLFQKLVRTGFGTNNVDHCTRLCHASSVAALLEASAPARYRIRSPTCSSPMSPSSSARAPPITIRSRRPG